MLVKYALRLVLIVAIFGANSVWSEQGAKAAEKLEETKVRLNLTDDQFVSIEPILIEDLTQKNQVLLEHGINLESGKRPTGGMNIRKARALANDMDSVREKTIEKLSVYLSDEQIQEYKKIQKENKEKIRERIKESR